MVWEIAIAFIVSLVYIIYALSYLKKTKKGSDKMQEVSAIIKKGAKTFLRTEFYVLFVVVLILGIVIFIFNKNLAIFFVVGAVLSAITSVVGMSVATSTNVKVSASGDLKKGLRIAFTAGLVASILGTMIGILGVYFVYKLMEDANILYGFAFGASLVALFLRVGGGIYTKSADVAADLVGKVERDLPEDDERNPAVIADLVGDNVGDVAGMNADLFESYVESIIAAMVLALAFSKDVFLPLNIASIGVVASVASIFVIRSKNPYRSLMAALIFSSLLVVVVSLLLYKTYAYNITLGVIAGLVTGLSVVYYTSYSRKPTRNVSEAATRGAALVVLRGMSNGMISTLIPVVTIAVVMILSFNSGGMYGIAITAVSMLSIVGVTLASTIYGSISDNASGINEICKMEKNRKITDTLDAAGNTTAAIGKGFAIGSAALTTLALLASFMTIAKITSIDIFKVNNLAVLFIGATLPFMFSSIVINSVSATAEKIVEEVRRQFKSGQIMAGKKKPNYEKVIGIATSSSIKSMFLPSILVVVTTLIIGLIFGVESLGSFIVGVTATSFLLGLFMANAGGSYDNAKKYIEKGNYGGKGSEAHKAAVVGDTVGDPLKDTAGPSLNIVLKLVAVTSLLLALILA